MQSLQVCCLVCQLCESEKQPASIQHELHCTLFCRSAVIRLAHAQTVSVLVLINTAVFTRLQEAIERLKAENARLQRDNERFVRLVRRARVSLCSYPIMCMRIQAHFTTLHVKCTLGISAL